MKSHLVQDYQVLPGNLCALLLLHLLGFVLTDLSGHGGALHPLLLSRDLCALLDLLLTRHFAADCFLYVPGHLSALLLLHLTRHLSAVLPLHLAGHLLALLSRLLAGDFPAIWHLHPTRHILADRLAHLLWHILALLSRHLDHTLFNADQCLGSGVYLSGHVKAFLPLFLSALLLRYLLGNLIKLSVFNGSIIPPVCGVKGCK